jgi:DUF1365 family protein
VPPRDGDQAGPAKTHRYTTGKVFHVSPFMDLGLDYTWVFSPPGERLVAHMNAAGRDGVFFDAMLTLARRSWTALQLRRALQQFPWTTAKVIAAIHWQALRLYLKGAPFHPHPGAASQGRPRRSIWKYV